MYEYGHLDATQAVATSCMHREYCRPYCRYFAGQMDGTSAVSREGTL